MLKLRKFIDDNMAVGGRQAVRQNFRELLGIQTVNRGGRQVQRLVPSEIKESYQDYSLLEVACEALGTTPRNAAHEIEEAEGTINDSSRFSYINGATDVIGGLVMAKVLEGYNDPQYLVDSLCEIEAVANVDAGYRILPSTDGTMPGDNLTNAEPYPSDGMTATRVHNLSSRRQGVVVEVTTDAIKLDLTGYVMAKAESAAKKILFQKEYRVCDLTLGIGTSPTDTPWLHWRDGVGTYPFRAAADTHVSPENQLVPHNYINAANIPLVDYDAIQAAMSIIGVNKDPITGLEISLELQDAKIFCAPTVTMDVRAGLHATEIIKGSQLSGGADFPTILSRGPNPLDKTYELVTSWIWFNRLRELGLGSKYGIGAGSDGVAVPGWSQGDKTTTANSAASYWMFGNFKKGLVYREFTPFRAYQAPLALADVRRSVAAAVVVEERGTPTWKDPRYVFRGQAI